MNLRPPAPKAGALAKLSYTPKKPPMHVKNSFYTKYTNIAIKSDSDRKKVNVFRSYLSDVELYFEYPDVRTGRFFTLLVALTTLI